MEMEIILNSSIRKLGQFGSFVKVKAGYGRYLINSNLALPSTKTNKDYFNAQKKELFKEHEKKVADAHKIQKECDNQWVYIIKKSNYDGSLYGSITVSDIHEELKKIVANIDRKIIVLNQVIRRIGIYELKIFIYDDIAFSLKINIASSIEEADRSKQSYIAELIKHDTEKKADEIRIKAEENNQ